MRTVLPDGVLAFLFRYNGTFYLFVCGWNGRWNRKDLNGAYQHVTYVYQSDNPFRLTPIKKSRVSAPTLPRSFRMNETTGTSPVPSGRVAV